MAELPTNLDDLKAVAEKLRHDFAQDLTNDGLPGFIADGVAALITSAWAWGSLFFMGILASLRVVIIPIAIAMIQAISQIRKDGAPEFAQVAGAVMGEFLGVEVPEDQLKGGVGVDANIARAAKLGGTFHDMLTKEFGGNGSVTPASGAAAARVFSGYNINFAAQNGIIGVLFDALSLHEFEGVRELGVQVAENLGLGRLHRQAMRPLIDNLITKPYDRFMRFKYRQDMLSDQQYVQAHLSGTISHDALYTALGQKGYADPLIDILVEQYTPHLSEREALSLVSVGKLSPEQAVSALTKNGWSATFAQQKLDAIAALDLLARERQLASEVVTLVKQRYMTSEDAAVQLAKLHISEAEQQTYRTEYGVYLEHQYRHFTMAEMLYMLERSLITQAEVDEWARSIGHTPQQVAQLDLLFAEKDIEYEQAVAAKKAAAEKKKKPTPPPPSHS